jgi:hypothetical protein
MRSSLTAFACALSILGASRAHAQSSDLLAHIRPGERANLATELGMPVEALPTYDLHLSVDAQMRGFGLRESVVFTNTESQPMREVAMRIFVNASVSQGHTPPVRFLEGRCLEGASCTITQTEPSVVMVRLQQPLAPGASLHFELDLQSVMTEIEESRLSMMSQSMEGLASLEGGSSSTHGDYGLVAHGAQIGSIASFYPVLARRTRGRWITSDGGTMGDLSTDAPHHVRARIVVPENFAISASGAEVSVANVNDPAGSPPRKEVTIHAAAVREFAVLVSPVFEEANCDVNGVRIRSFYLPQDRAAGHHVRDVACASLGVFERRFGPYPYTELDIVEAPLVGGAGGVEFSGLVTVAMMFYRPGSMDAGGMGGMLGMLGGAGGAGGGAQGGGQGAGLDQMTTSMREFVTAHEVAHQWWHGLVGSDSRAHPWVDESLAQYSAMIYMQEQYGDARALEEGERQVAMNYRMMRVQGESDAQVDRPASAFTTPMSYAGLVYGKGPFFYRAVRRLIGDEAFYRGLSSYVQAFRFREAEPGDVVDHLARASATHDAEVHALSDRWLRQTHGDDDLGPSTMRSVMRTMMPPQMRGMLDDPMMGPLIEQLMGSMLGGGGGSGGEGPAIDPAMLEQLRQLQP